MRRADRAGAHLGQKIAKGLAHRPMSSPVTADIWCRLNAIRDCIRYFIQLHLQQICSKPSRLSCSVASAPADPAEIPHRSFRPKASIRRHLGDFEVVADRTGAVLRSRELT